jgi:hypothetical protein
MRRSALLLLVLLVAASWDLAHAQGCNGLGVSPIEVRLASAQPAQSYRSVVSIQNPCTYDRVIHTERTGVPGNWTTLSPATFNLAASSRQDVEVLVHIPDAQGPGAWQGYLRFVADPGAGPAGSGQAVSAAVAVPLNVTVGGTPVEKIVYLDARVQDAPQGSDVHAFVTARNDGNVRTAAKANGQVLQFDADNVLKEASGTLAIDPGGTGEVPVTFEKGLAIGQYRARLRGDGFEKTLEFKVVLPGTLPSSGTLKAILHAARVTAGQPARLDGWFQNTGDQPIGSAVLKAEVRKDGVLLAPLQSDSLSVPAGASVNLTVYWTPPDAGTYTIVGKVLYDGFFTAESTSLLNVDAGSGASWLWLVLLALAVVALVLAFILFQQRKRRAKPLPPKR